MKQGEKEQGHFLEALGKFGDLCICAGFLIFVLALIFGLLGV